jgi:hypothetical protein
MEVLLLIPEVGGNTSVTILSNTLVSFVPPSSPYKMLSRPSAFYDTQFKGQKIELPDMLQYT